MTTKTEIVILGLGPGSPSHLTLEAREVLDAAASIYVRTKRHPTVAALPPRVMVHSFDQVYEESARLEEVYARIAREVIAAARREQRVIYAVPGHPLVGEATVREILHLAPAHGITVRLVAGLSFLEPALVALVIDPLAAGLQVLDATDLRRVDATLPAIVAQIDSQRLASHVKLTLLDYYPPDHLVSMVSWAGVPDREKVIEMELHQIDRGLPFDHLSCLYVPPVAAEANYGAVAGLEAIVARLRAPDGCPWDREQTHTSIKPYLLEETYEVLDALDQEDAEKLREELGDLLLQIILHVQLAVEGGEFALPDVLREITTKLVRRHPHVFANTQVADSEEVLRNWEAIKQGERQSRAPAVGGRKEGFTSMLASVPRSMPALAYAQSVQRRAGRVGFDWPGIDQVLDKLHEELKELAQAADRDQVLAEFGDVLFSLVNVARWLNVDAEESLRLANQRFAGRFARMEARCAERGLVFGALTPAEQNALWEEAKRAETGPNPSLEKTDQS